jgi:hypothetical protein
VDAIQKEHVKDQCSNCSAQYADENLLDFWNQRNAVPVYDHKYYKNGKAAVMRRYAAFFSLNAFDSQISGNYIQIIT